MKIALLGYGKMGKEIEKLAISRKHEVPLIIDINNTGDLTSENLKKVDVAIDFSIPKSAYENIIKCFNANTPIVSGTTGWMDKFDEVKKLCKDKNQTFFYASNYSLGVNIFFKLNERLAEIMNHFNNYDVSMTELHHIHKLDAPSGTAISLADGIIKNIDRKKQWTLLPKKAEDAVVIEAIRKDEIPGTHIIKYDSAVDYIEIAHYAKSRQGFVLGAMVAAEFIHGKKGFFNMDDVLNL